MLSCIVYYSEGVIEGRFSQKSAKLFCQFIQLLNAYDFGLNKLLKEISEKRLFLHKSQTFALVILKEKLSDLRANAEQYRLWKQELKMTI